MEKDSIANNDSEPFQLVFLKTQKRAEYNTNKEEITLITSKFLQERMFFRHC